MEEKEKTDNYSEIKDKIINILRDEGRPIKQSKFPISFPITERKWIEYLYQGKEIVEIECQYPVNGWKNPKTGQFTINIERDVYYFLYELLHDFWLNEIEIILTERKSEISLASLKELLVVSFTNYYSLKRDGNTTEDISYRSCNAGINYEYRNLIEFLELNSDKFYFKKDSIYVGNAQLRIGLRTWIDTGIALNPKDIIKNEIIKSAFGKSDISSLPLSNIAFRINRLPINAGIPKPYSEKLIEEIILSDKFRFKYSNSSKIVELIDDLTYYSTILNKEQMLLKEFNFNYEKSGFLAFTFVGKEFPLVEAEEYASIRPIIYVYSVDSLAKEFESIIKNNKPQSSELMLYLEAVLPPEINPTDWLEENITISFVKSDSDTIKKISNQLISKLSPVFNVKNNPGNLFQYTLKSLLDERDKKAHGII